VAHHDESVIIGLLNAVTLIGINSAIITTPEAIAICVEPDKPELLFVWITSISVPECGIAAIMKLDNGIAGGHPAERFCPDCITICIEFGKPEGTGTSYHHCAAVLSRDNPECSLAVGFIYLILV
jgi:hypothetical protein